MLQEWGLGMRLGLVAGVPSMWANQIAEFKTSSYNLIGWLIDHNYIRFLPNPSQYAGRSIGIIVAKATQT